jgi:hypothetical protein
LQLGGNKGLAGVKMASLVVHPNRIEPGDILTPEQLSARLQVPVSWVYKHSNNSLPVLRCGRYLRFSWPDVCAWLRSEKKTDIAI